MKKYLIEKKKQGKVTLLRHVTMPKHALFDEASIAIRCTEVSFPEGIKVKQRTHLETEKSIVTSFELKETPFIVRYKLDANYDPKSEIDVAGNWSVKEKKDPNDSEEKEGWLNQARNERTELEKTENGKKLLAEYQKHQKAYNLAFSVKTFADVWNDPDGVTQNMARDTHSALQKGTAVNENSYNSVNGKVSYNKHAFDISYDLQLTLLGIMGDEEQIYNNAETPGGRVTTDELQNALDAIDNFQNEIYDKCSKDKTIMDPEPDDCKIMTKDEIYDTINNASERIPKDSKKTNPHIIYKYYQKRLLNQANDRIKDEIDKYGKESFFRKFFSETQMRSKKSSIILHEGEFKGLLTDNGLNINVLIEKINGKTSNIKVLNVSIPDFEMNIDSEKWSSEYKSMLEKKVQDVTFVKEIVRNTLQEGVKQFVCGELAKYENIQP